MMTNIVAFVDLDDENSCRIVLPAAFDYAKHKGAQLHVLTVVPDGMFKMTIVAQLIPQDYERKLLDDAKQRLEEMVEETVRVGQALK